MVRLIAFAIGGGYLAWYDAAMHHPFLYGAHSFQTELTAQNIATLYQLGHTAHVRVVNGSLKRYELRRELQILHYLRHYGVLTLVDILNNKNVHYVSQHMRECIDYRIDGGQDFIVSSSSDIHQLLSFQHHSKPVIVLEHDPHDIVASLRCIEAAQEQGVNIQGYFYRSSTAAIRPSDLIFRAVIRNL